MRPTIVLTSAVSWSGVTARPHHFARLLAARGWPVLFVDAPVTLLGPVKNPSLRPLLLPKPVVRDISVAGANGWLRVLSPCAQLPFGNMWRWVNRLNQRWLAYFIRVAAPGPYVLLATLPGNVDLIPRLRPLAVLYDCVDFHAEFPGFVRPETVNQMEQELVALSRAVFATADALYERMAAWHGSVTLLPNAAETEHFAQTLTSPVHPALAAIPEPRVAFVGGIGGWIDLDFIRVMAQARPHVHFIMIGPVETDTSALQRCANVHFVGRQPYAELPQWLAGCQAALVAFKRNALAQSVNPVKVYEYIAAGREVIATPIREVVKLRDLVWLAEDGQAAVAALDRILAGERKVTETARQAFVRAHTWSARVDRLEEALLAALPSRWR